MISRRTFIGSSLLATLGVTAWPRFVSLFTRSSKNSSLDLLCGIDGKHLFASERNPESHVRTLSMNPLAIPPVITGGTLMLASGTVPILAGTGTNMLLINNSFPAPTIKVKMGDTFSATVHNNLTASSVLHWHGIHAPASMSGHPKDAVGIGDSYSVSFPIIQRASTNFYHAHPDMTTGEQVYMGMVGAFIISDEAEEQLGLPSGDFDIPLLITDKRFDANNQLIYSPGNEDGKSGWIGDMMLVNGTANASLTVAPTLYRFRLINASNARFFNLGLSDGTSFTLIGNDGGFLSEPAILTSAMFSPAERLDLLIDFSKYSQGETVTLQSLSFTNADPPSTCSVPQGAAFNLLEFQIDMTGSSNGTVPTSLPQITPYQAHDATQTRTFAFAFGGEINGLAFSMDRIDELVPFGELEEWQFVNEASNTHPVHVHGAQFQMVSRNGNPPDAWESGWKDVVRLNPADTINVLIQFTDYTGIFLIHCHKLEHADMGMMSNFEVDPTNVVSEESAATQTIEIYPNPASSIAKLSFPSLTRLETLLVVNETGAVMLEKIVPADANVVLLELYPFASGTYRIVVGTARGNLVIAR